MSTFLQHLPLFPTTVIGSLPRPAWLLDLLTEEEETNDPLGQAYNLIEEAWYRFLLNTASPAEAIEWMDIDEKEKEKE